MKTRDIIVSTILIIIGVYCLCNIGSAEVYTVPNFMGALNVATDGRDLDPDQALDLTNWTLDTLGSLVPRQGFSYWDSLVVQADSEIQAIYIYKPYDGTQRMVIVVGGFIYINSSLSDPYNADWDTLRMGFTGDSLQMVDGSKIVITIQNDWWLMRVSNGDVLWDTITGGSGTEYTIDYLKSLNDSLLYVDANYGGGGTDTLAYTIYHKIRGNPHIVQYDDDLYISDSEGFPLIYDDTVYNFVPLVDSGLVSDTASLNTDVIRHPGGKVHISYLSNKISGNVNTSFQSTWGGKKITVYLPNECGGTTKWSSAISSVDSINKIITTVHTLSYPTGGPGYYCFITDTWNDYFITEFHDGCTPSTGWAVEDDTKEWVDIGVGGEIGSDYLVNLYAIPPSTIAGGYFRRIIYCQTESTFSIPANANTPDTGRHYYIFAQVPYDFTSVSFTSDIYECPRFEQMHFYNSQLFGYGYQRYPPSGAVIDTIFWNRLWYSHIAMPFYIHQSYHDDVDTNIRVLFDLRNNLYIGTEVSIWRLSGTLKLKGRGADAIKSKVVSNNGIPDFDNWAKATEEYGYFANRTGVYRFDGVRPEKISLQIDPIIQKYYGSRIVMGYFPAEQKLFLSFPDSGVTYFYDERFAPYKNVWVGPWDFGMTCFYAPADTNIFYFGHSEFKGRVYYYPNGRYQDIVAVDDTNDIAVAYESGWQSFDAYWINKKIGGVNQGAYFPVKNYNSAVIRLYADFNTSQCDSVVCDSTGWFVYYKQFGNDCIGEYFKTRFEATVDTFLIFGGYRYVWEETPSWIK